MSFRYELEKLDPNSILSNASWSGHAFAIVCLKYFGLALHIAHCVITPELGELDRSTSTSYTRRLWLPKRSRRFVRHKIKFNGLKRTPVTHYVTVNHYTVRRERLYN
jgi:hypothetical protein